MALAPPEIPCSHGPCTVKDSLTFYKDDLQGGKTSQSDYKWLRENGFHGGPGVDCAKNLPSTVVQPKNFKEVAGAKLVLKWGCCKDETSECGGPVCIKCE